MEIINILNEIEGIKKYVEASIWQEVTLNRWDLIKRLDALKEIVKQQDIDDSSNRLRS